MLDETLDTAEDQLEAKELGVVGLLSSSCILSKGRS